MVDWRALEAKVDQTIGATFGEEVRLSFMKNGVADPGRPMIQIRCLVFHAGGNDSNAPGSMAEGGVFRTRLSSGEAEVFIDRSTYAGPMPKQGDRVRANERHGQTWWEVATVSDRYSNLLVLSLTQL